MGPLREQSGQAVSIVPPTPGLPADARTPSRRRSIRGAAIFFDESGIHFGRPFVFLVTKVRRHTLEPDTKEKSMGFVNEARWDRVARVVAGVVLLVLGWAVIGGTVGAVIGVVAFVPLVTGLVGWCPLYSVFNIATKRGPREGSAT